MDIPYGRHHLSQEDIDAVLNTLQSDYITQGSMARQFEDRVSTMVQANYGVVVNSATSALHISCLALGLKKGDYLWTSAITFVASANCGLSCGAKVDFVDIDKDTYNICPKALEEKLIKAKKNNTLPKIVIPVHMGGQSCNMLEIFKLSKKFGFKIIEDASHAIGGKYLNDSIGSCKYSDITVFSFHPVKIITTIEGGMALTNDHTLAYKMTLYREHGITKNTEHFVIQTPPLWHYEQHEIGYNYRMNDVQASLGLSQLNRLSYFITMRNKIATNYNSILKDLPIKLPFIQKESLSAFHLFIIRLNLKEIKKTHKEVFNNLHQKGIKVGMHYMPVYLHPYYKDLGFKEGYCPNSEDYFNSAITLPIYPRLTTTEQNYISKTLGSLLL